MRNESNEVVSPSEKKICDLLKERGFKPCNDGSGDLEFSVAPEWLLKHSLYLNMVEIKIRMVKNGEDSYLPKYIFSHVIHGVILNTTENTEAYLKEIFGL